MNIEETVLGLIADIGKLNKLSVTIELSRDVNRYARNTKAVRELVDLQTSVYARINELVVNSVFKTDVERLNELEAIAKKITDPASKAIVEQAISDRVHILPSHEEHMQNLSEFGDALDPNAPWNRRNYNKGQS